MTLIVTVTIRKTLKATARKIEINIVIARELGTLTETMKLTETGTGRLVAKVTMTVTM